VVFSAGVFCLFSTVGFLTLTMPTYHLSSWEILWNVLLSGGAAVVYALAAVHRKFLFMPLMFLLQAAGFTWLGSYYGHRLPLTDVFRLSSQVRLLSVGGIVALSAGYVLFLVFFSREGARYFRAHAEIELARELHHALVPEIQRRIGPYEIYGASIPSGEVGGDLVDLVESGDEWTAYVADVYGHGVSPGVLMAMFKAAVRTQILSHCNDSSLLEGVHQTLYPLKTSNMFVTAGFFHAQGERLTLLLAGHPALLHFQRETAQVCEYPPQDLPLGILPVQTFTSRNIDCQPGDILLLLTDGITEASDRAGTEMGAEPIKFGLRQWADLPLPQLFHNLRQLALDFGKQQDDQTMLLVRWL
jgi:sigma-B regulation protein RsbU (phosphoserine phosphatase)